MANWQAQWGGSYPCCSATAGLFLSPHHKRLQGRETGLTVFRPSCLFHQKLHNFYARKFQYLFYYFVALLKAFNT